MSNKKLGQEAAFPMQQVESGMSKRFYAACAAMQGVLSNSELIKHTANNKSSEEATVAIIKIAFCLADELLKQENE